MHLIAHLTTLFSRVACTQAGWEVFKNLSDLDDMLTTEHISGYIFRDDSNITTCDSRGLSNEPNPPCNDSGLASKCTGLRIVTTKPKTNLSMRFLNSLLPNLETLSINGNRTALHVLADSTGQHTNIKHLAIMRSELVKESLKNVCSLNLEILELSNVLLSDFDEDIPIENLKNSLRLLNISNCYVFSDLTKKFTGQGGLNLSDNLLGSSNNPIYTFETARNTLSFQELGLPRPFKSISDLKTFMFFNPHPVFFPFLNGQFGFGSLESAMQRLVAIVHNTRSFTLIEKLSEFEKLEDLNMSNTNLSWLGGDFSFGKLQTTLKRLDMRNCKINSSVLMRASFENLEELDLSGNNLSFLDSSFDLGKLKNTLKKLNLEDCSLKLDVVKQLADFVCLEELNLSKNEVSVIGSQTISNSEGFSFGGLAKTLKRLNLGSCAMNTQIIQELASFEQLEELDLSETDLSFLDSSFDFGNLKKTLKKLDLKLCKLNPAVAEKLTQFDKLEELLLRDTSVLGSVRLFSSFGNLQKTLKVLYLSSFDVNLVSLKKLTLFEQLNDLCLWDGDLSSLDSSFDLGNLKRTLKNLELHSCELSENGVNYLQENIQSVLVSWRIELNKYTSQSMFSVKLE